MNNGKVALVTGGGAGIGKAIAHRLAKDGYIVVVNGRRPENTQETVEEIKRLKFDAIGIVADVSVEREVVDMVEKVIEKYGRIDVLVNNAGVCPIRGLDKVTSEGFEHTMRTNVFSMFYCCMGVSKYMINQRSGKIINAGSQSSFRQSPQTIEYATSKWAVRGLTRTFAAALAPYNINVNAYCPGTVITPMQLGVAEERGRMANMTAMEYYEKIRFKDIPLGRDQPADEIAAFVSFLASESAQNITGQCVMINGGQVMC
ncbi:MAG: SDR family NAD(P)-dependent oxidoreductase [Synergistaceae bacterium]|jgi:NAD(P)-dependent dehydrogenase (short-subunit alcohol dehydrogenase family)|nr:SDR family NAD(P)-dependent oxidoreductase [Synergistaceae bacterium]